MIDSSARAFHTARTVTYRVGGEFWWVVIDVGDPDDRGGGVGQAVGGVALHVGGLDDQRVLRDFLQTPVEQTVKHRGTIGQYLLWIKGEGSLLKQVCSLRVRTKV